MECISTKINMYKMYFRDIYRYDRLSTMYDLCIITNIIERSTLVSSEGQKSVISRIKTIV